MPGHTTDEGLRRLLEDPIKWEPQRLMLTVDRGPLHITETAAHGGTSRDVEQWYNRDPAAAKRALDAEGIGLDVKDGLWRLSRVEEAPPEAVPKEFSHRDRYYHYETGRELDWREAQVYNARKIAESESEYVTVASEADRDVPAPPGKEYFPYQKSGILTASERGNALIADEMGLGKTIQALGVLNTKPEAKRVLVIAPLSVRDNWLKEANEWLVNKPDNMCAVNSTTGTDCIPAEGPVFAVTNFESFRPRSKIAKELRDGKWDAVIIDEAHRLKNTNAQQTIGVLGQMERSKRGRTQKESIQPIQADIKLALTGTPPTARPDEMYGVLSWLDPQNFPPTEAHETNFKRRYALVKGEDGEDTALDSRNEAELQRILRSTVMIRRKKEDVLSELPPKRRRVVVKKAETAKERAAVAEGQKYEQQYGSIVDLKGALGGKKSIRVTEMGRVLDQMAEAKAPWVADYVADAAETGEPLVFFSDHLVQIDVVANELESRGIPYLVMTGDDPPNNRDRQKRMDAFQDRHNPKANVMLTTMAVGGEGVNFTRAERAIFGELQWDATKLAQSEDRLHRIGQDNHVLIDQLVMADSLDANLAQVVNRKMESQKKILGVSDSAMVNRGTDAQPGVDRKRTTQRTPVVKERKAMQASTDDADAANEAGLLRGNRRAGGRRKKEKDASTPRVNIMVA